MQRNMNKKIYWSCQISYLDAFKVHCKDVRQDCSKCFFNDSNNVFAFNDFFDQLRIVQNRMNNEEDENGQTKYILVRTAIKDDTSKRDEIRKQKDL